MITYLFRVLFRCSVISLNFKNFLKSHIYVCNTKSAQNKNLAEKEIRTVQSNDTRNCGRWTERKYTLYRVLNRASGVVSASSSTCEKLISLSY